MKQQIIKLFEVIVWIAFVLIVIAGIGVGAAMSSGYNGPTLAGVFFGMLGGVTAGAIVTGFCMTLLSINEHLSAIRQAVGGEAVAPQPAVRSGALKPMPSGESRYHYLDAGNQPQGPVTLAWLREALGRGELAADVRIAQTGDKSWRPLQSVLDASG